MFHNLFISLSVFTFLYTSISSAHISFPGAGRPSGYGGYIGISLSLDDTGLENIKLDCGDFTVKGIPWIPSYNLNYKRVNLALTKKGEINPFYIAKETVITLVAARHGQQLYGISISQYDYLNNYSTELRAKYYPNSSEVRVLFKIASSESNDRGQLYECKQQQGMKSHIVPLSKFAKEIARIQKVYDNSWVTPTSPNPWENREF